MDIDNLFKKYKYALILSLIFVFLGFSGIADASDGQLIVDTDVLNVRPTAGTDHDRIGQINRGDIFSIIEQDGEWYKIKLPNGSEGWVLSKYCTIDIKETNVKENQREIKVVVDGKTVKFDVLPYINSENRTMVPIRFIGEELGASFTWAATDQRVTIVKEDEEVLLWVGKSEALVNSELITMDTQVELVDGRTMVPLRFISESFGSDVKWDAANHTAMISKPAVIKEENGIDRVLVTGSTVNVRNAPSTESTIVVDRVKQGDILEIIGEKTNNWFNVLTKAGVEGWISGDWALALSANTESSSTRDSLASRGTGRVVSFNGVVDNPDYPALIALEYEEQEDAFFLTITGNEGLFYTTTTLYNPYRVVIDIKGVKVDLPLNKVGIIDIKHPFVSEIRVSQYTSDTGRIVLELTEPRGHQILSRSGDNELVVLLKKQALAGKVIVIDPGHGNIASGGWDDPGASGPTGLKEKDVVMDIANTVTSILKEQGAEVILTRNGSTTLTLEGRSELANSIGADILVSIHANASTSRDTMGTSTYFYAPSDDPILGPQRADRIRLAKLVQTGVVKYGGRPDLGIMVPHGKPFKILNETLMPSILVETAFISNPTEEKLLRDPQFRDRVAQGIAEGIMDYFK